MDKEYYMINSEEVVNTLNGNLEGLSSKEVKESQHGQRQVQEMSLQIWESTRMFVFTKGATGHHCMISGRKVTDF